MSASIIKQLLAAVAFAVAVTVVIIFLGDALMGPTDTVTPASKQVEETEAPAEAEAESEAEADEVADSEEEGAGLAEALAEADIEDGQTIAKKCKACHSFDEGGANKVGPNLWGVVGKAKGAAVGYKYSAAMQEIGGDWTYEDLDAFLTKPRDFLPGTRMTYVGLSKQEDRAALIVYLRSLADEPVPLP